MKRLLPLVCLILMLASCSSGGGNGPVKPFVETPYYPLKVGNSWSFLEQGNTAKIVSKVVKQERIGDMMCFKIETTVDGKPAGSEHIATTADGIYRCALNGNPSSSPILLLKLPPQKGETWTIDVKVDGEHLTGKVETHLETRDTKVPAGTYQAIYADAKLEVNGQPILSQMYFTPGIGLIRTQLMLVSKSSIFELEKFVPAN